MVMASAFLIKRSRPLISKEGYIQQMLAQPAWACHHRIAFNCPCYCCAPPYTRSNFQCLGQNTALLHCRQHQPAPPVHVYVPDVTTLPGEAAVFRDLDQGHAPRPEHTAIIRSRGAAGLLMRFVRPSCIPDVLLALSQAPGQSQGWVCLTATALLASSVATICAWTQSLQLSAGQLCELLMICGQAGLELIPLL